MLNIHVHSFATHGVTILHVYVFVTFFFIVSEGFFLHIQGVVGKYPLLVLSQKPLNSFQKFFLFFFKVLSTHVLKILAISVEALV